MPTTILVCDDEEAIRELVRETLDGDGRNVIEAVDGIDALRIARRLAPQLILLDMMMPGRGGLSVLEELRGDPALAGTPVIVLTARAHAADRAAAVAGGADGYMSKPFSPRRLLALVEAILAARR